MPTEKRDKSGPRAPAPGPGPQGGQPASLVKVVVAPRRVGIEGNRVCEVNIANIEIDPPRQDEVATGILQGLHRWARRPRAGAGPRAGANAGG